MRTPRLAGFAVAFCFALAAGLLNWSTVGARQQAVRGAAPQPLDGASATRLPDGRWLLLGGNGPTGASGRTAVLDPATGSETRLVGTLLSPRSGHTATVLPDGTVLVVGGRNRGAFVQSAEIFDPSTGLSAPLSMDGTTERALHTATLLTDGRVLVVGGVSSAAAPAPVEIWNLETHQATAMGATVDRVGHTATLLPDGRVLIEAGHVRSGEAVRMSAIIDAATMTLAGDNRETSDGARPSVAASSPENGARDVPVDARIAVRFSEAMRIQTLTKETVRLAIRQGRDLPIQVVGAENGRLMFVWPLEPLGESETYDLALDGLATDEGVALGRQVVTFSTREKREPVETSDLESWSPSTDALRDGWKTNRARSPWESLPPLVAAPGVTAISGRVLTLNGQPLPGVTLRMNGATTESDRSGRFLLQPEAAGARQILDIDGTTANRPGRQYGFFEYGMAVDPGRTNVLPFTIWMTRLDTRHVVSIPAVTMNETVVTTPSIPGLELHLPPGTTIRGEDGEPVREIGITAIPVDRPPFPLPSIDVPVYFTIQPGGAYVFNRGPERGARLVYPNYRQAWPGKRVQFYHYDPGDKGWFVYGMGTVGEDARQVFPDQRTRIYKFTGAMINAGMAPPPEAPPPGECEDGCGGDPVSLSTGIFFETATDFVLADVIPIALTRTYRTRDLDVRPFGVGTTHPYAMFLYSEMQYEQADLVLPDGAKIHYVRTSPGVGYADAVFAHEERPAASPPTVASPTVFYKSVLAWNGNGWDLRLQDGSVYVFGDVAPLQSIRDRYGNTVRLTWSDTNTFGSGFGKIMKITSPNNRWISFTYDTSDRIIQAQDNIGRAFTYGYDANGNLATVTDPENRVTTYTYDAQHRMLTVKPPHLQGTPGNLVVNEYTTAADAPTPIGWVKRQTHADGGTFEFAYTVNNGKSTQTDLTDPRGYVRRVTFNTDGYMETETRALGQPEQQVTSITRQTGTNLVLSRIDPLNRHTVYTYDGYGHILTATNMAGTSQAATRTYTYESNFGQVATITDSLNHTTTIGYDNRGNRTSVTDPLNHTATIAYNAAGQIIKLTDPLQHAIEVTYRGSDIATITDALGRMTTRFYDAAGRMLSHTSPLGDATEYTYDKADRVTQVTDPLNGTTAYGYGPFTQVQAVTDAMGHTTTFGYDAFERVTTRRDPLMASDYVSYDLAGNPSQRADRRGNVTNHAFDGLNRVTQVTYADGSSTAYAYDAGDRVVTINDSVDGTITRTYDDFDNLESETTSRGSISYTSDSVGRRLTMTVTGKPVVSYEYDDADRLIGVIQGTSVVTLDYDDANRRTSMTLPNGLVVTYGYDLASQVTSITYTLGATTLGTLTYAYDAAGRRIEIGGTWARTGLPQAVASAVYDAANRLTQWMGRGLAHDANGNLLSDGFTDYVWNARNQLAGTTGTTSTSFSYDGALRRTGRTAAGQSKTFLFDNENIVEELVGGVPNADHLTNLSLDEGWSRSDSQGVAFTLADVLGSSVARVDANGVVKTQYTFEPFGTAQATGAADPNLAGYTGRETDASNLVFYRARYYNPALQRFISEDPADVAGGINLYAYVGNRPLDFTDPTGMNPLRQFCENVRRKIQNITKDIEKREAELLADKLKLPETCVEDLWKPSTSKRGHRKIISDLKGDLGLWEILNSLFCGGNSTPGTPQVVPELPPIPVPPPPTPQQQVVIVGAAGTAILTYWWVVVFAM